MIMMLPDGVRLSPARSPRQRRPALSPAKVFACVVQLYYQPDFSLKLLAQQLDLSESATKRCLHVLRRENVIDGRLGSHRLHLASLCRPPSCFARAVIAAESDTQELKTLSRAKKSSPYRSEEELLAWLRHVLPCTQPYEGAVIVESGHVLMGEPASSLLLTVYAASHNILFDFARQGVECADGIVRTKTMMIAHTDGEQSKDEMT